MTDCPPEAFDEMKRHAGHFCSLGYDQESNSILFACSQCQVALFEVAGDD